MKQYMNNNGLAMFGKAKHIRKALNRLAKSKYGHYTLTQYTEQRPQMRITLGQLFNNH